MKKPSEKMLIVNSAILISIVQFVAQPIMGVIAMVIIAKSGIIEAKDVFVSIPVVVFAGWLLSMPAIIGTALVADKLNKRRVRKYEKSIAE